MRLFRFLLILIILVKLNSLYCLQDSGFKIGFDLSTLSGQDMIDPRISPNISLGSFLNFRISDRLCLQPELFFTKKIINFDGRVSQHFDNDNDGFTDEDPADLLDNDGDGLIDEDRVDYFCNGNGNLDSNIIEIPVLLKYLPYQSAKNRISLFIGPSINFILSHSIDAEDSSPSELIISDDHFDLSGVIGLDFNYDRLIVELRFSNSIIKNDWEIDTSFPFPGLDPPGFYPRILKSNFTSFSLFIGLLM